MSVKSSSSSSWSISSLLVSEAHASERVRSNATSTSVSPIIRQASDNSFQAIEHQMYAEAFKLAADVNKYSSALRSGLTTISRFNSVSSVAFSSASLYKDSCLLMDAIRTRNEKEITKQGAKIALALGTTVVGALFGGPPGFATGLALGSQGGSAFIDWLYSDPLIIDLDGDGIELIQPSSSSVFFDISGSNFFNQIGWVAADDGILVHDIDGDGTPV